MVTNEIAVQKEKPNLRTIMVREDVKSRFIDVLGSSEANAYISSVLITVAQSEALQRCSANSIIASALRAAAMRLAVDPGTAQAYLVPYKGQATLIVGWKGLWQMALRTGKYRYLNVTPVYENDELTEDPLTGLHTLKRFDLPLDLAKDQPRGENDVVGYLLYFELFAGFKKSFYMTCAECDAHGKKYSASYSSTNSIWKTDPHAMYRKTVIRIGLTRYGYLDPMALMMAETVDEVSDPIVPEYVDGEVSVDEDLLPEPVEQPLDELNAKLGFGRTKERPYHPTQLKQHIVNLAARHANDRADNKQRNTLAGVLNLCFAHNGADMDRHELCQFLTGTGSTKKIPDSMVFAMWDWLEVGKDSSGAFMPCDMAVREANAALTYARKENGQQELFQEKER